MATSSRPEQPPQHSGGSSAAPLHAQSLLGGEADPGTSTIPAAGSGVEPAGFEETTQALAPR